VGALSQVRASRGFRVGNVRVGVFTAESITSLANDNCRIKEATQMAKFDYAAYEAVFNTGNEDALMETFYAKDIVFVSGPRTKKGREELSEYLKWVGSVVPHI